MWHSVAYESVLHVAQHCGISGGLWQTPAKHVCPPGGFVLGLCTEGEMPRREDSSVYTRPRLQFHTPIWWHLALVGAQCLRSFPPQHRSKNPRSTPQKVQRVSCVLKRPLYPCGSFSAAHQHAPLGTRPQGSRCLRHTVSGAASTPVVLHIVANDSNARSLSHTHSNATCCIVTGNSVHVAANIEWQRCLHFTALLVPGEPLTPALAPRRMHADRVFSVCYMFPNLVSLSLMLRYDPPAHLRVNVGYAFFLLCMTTVPGMLTGLPARPMT
jgi:hypothetical protein